MYFTLVRRPAIYDVIMAVFDAFENPLCAIQFHSIRVFRQTGRQSPKLEFFDSIQKPIGLLLRQLLRSVFRLCGPVHSHPGRWLSSWLEARFRQVERPGAPKQGDERIEATETCTTAPFAFLTTAKTTVREGRPRISNTIHGGTRPPARPR